MNYKIPFSITLLIFAGYGIFYWTMFSTFQDINLTTQHFVLVQEANATNWVADTKWIDEDTLVVISRDPSQDHSYHAKSICIGLGPHFGFPKKVLVTRSFNKSDQDSPLDEWTCDTR